MSFEFMIYVPRFLRNYLTIILSLFLVSSLASAQRFTPVRGSEFTADPGIYDTVTFGDDIALDGCSSSFEGFSFCEMNDLSDFALAWRVAPVGNDPRGPGTTAALYNLGSDLSSVNGFTDDTVFGNNVRDGLNFRINTGDESAFFSTPGSYTVQLTLFLRGNQTVTLPNSDIVHTFFSGSIVRRTETVIDLVRAPVTIPEPAGYLILIPAIYFVTRRQRKLAAAKAQYS